MASEPKEKITPQSLVKEEVVRKVLQQDKGKGAQLVSWEMVNFTKPGDNHLSIVTSIQVKYNHDGQEHDTVYVVKLSPCRGDKGTREMNNAFFTIEASFYLELLPELNSVLKSIGEPPLSFAHCFHSVLDMNKEQIYFEDLRKRGFKMFDRRKGMDVAHVSLVMKEQARLHSASLIYQARYPQVLRNRHEFILKDFITVSENSKEILLPMFETSIDNSVQMLEKIGRYEKEINWAQSLKPELEEIFSTGLKNNKYDVVCHGDCWNNNLLFRYNSEGDPVEVMLLDLQLCRLASPATDLNYLMYTSIAGDVRARNVNNFLNTYYSTFKRVMDADGSVMPFSEDELYKEFRAKNKLGAVFGMLIVPVLLMEPEEVPDVSGEDNVLQSLMEGIGERGMDMLDTNPLVKPRFLAIFEEMAEAGLIS